MSTATASIVDTALPEDDKRLEKWLPWVLASMLAGANWMALQVNATRLATERDAAVLRFMADRPDDLQAIQSVTRDRVSKALTESEPETAIRDLFASMIDHRPKTIALQLAGSAWEAGGTREMVLQVIPARQWITQRDLRVRTLHVILDGQCRRPDEAFTTAAGFGVMYPRDPDGELRMILNCRCFTAPLARGCGDGKASYLTTETKRQAYWKAANAAMGTVERRLLAQIRTTFRQQRAAVLAAL